mgnify:CR=1 FL=1
MEFHITGKAKIERWFRTMKDQWMSKLNMHDFESLDDLRDSLMHWVQKYNQSPHSSLNGKTPQDRFFEESSLIIRMDEERIEKTFLLETERRVSRDNVITLEDKEYEVNYKYAGQKLLLRYSPDLSKIYSVDRRNGELEEIGNRINETSLQLKKQNQARANWISGVSHDIRTPLSMIMGYADRISSSLNVEENARKQANIIKIQSVKIKNLVQDLNLVSQLNYNVQPHQEKPVHFCKLIREIVAEYLNSNINNKFEFELNLNHNTEQITIIGDERLLCRAIQNIISNSINHNENGCIISVRLEINGNNLELVISDNGKGISEKELQKIQSTPHYLQSTDNRLDLRHGLGLLLVKEIISIHNGTVSISSALNNGFSTTISLPIKKQ